MSGPSLVAVQEQEQLQEYYWWLLESNSNTDIKEETAEASVSFDDYSDSSAAFWSSGFPPPPPRPPYLSAEEDQISPDGLTTCDLCTWALQRYPDAAAADTTDTVASFTGGITYPWPFTLILVSLLSALLGAIVMITVVHCKSRISSTDFPGFLFPIRRRRRRNENRSEKTGEEEFTPNNANKDMQGGGIQNVPLKNLKTRNTWSLLNYPSNISAEPATNHYTMEESYASINEEAVYTELDRISSSVVPVAAYQNSTYAAEPESSAPSSAYYSDISSSHSRGYEAVGHPTTTNWEIAGRRPQPDRSRVVRSDCPCPTQLHSNYI